MLTVRVWGMGCLLLAWFGLAPVVAAAETQDQRLTRSIDYASHSERLPELEELLPEPLSRLRQVGYRQPQGPGGLRQARSSCQCVLPDVQIFETRVELIWDADEDGFYHQFSLSFDADTDRASSWVFAKLYVSYEGGPWNYLHTSRSFQLVDRSTTDEYTIETALDRGYPTGYYDLLLELYDADSGSFLTSVGPHDDLDFYALPLEDQTQDPWSYSDSGYEFSSYVYGGGGLNLGWLAIAMLGVQGVRARGT